MEMMLKKIQKKKIEKPEFEAKKENILEEFKLFHVDSGGIGNWLTDDANDIIFERLSDIDKNPLSMEEFNQLLVLGNEAPVTRSFFDYYWLSCPDQHPYDISKLPDFPGTDFLKHHNDRIISLSHLKWGLYRFYVDALLYFGNIRSAFRTLRNSSDVDEFFKSKRLYKEDIKRRGASLKLKHIPIDNRHLIAEMACQSFENRNELKKLVIERYKDAVKRGGKGITIRKLINNEWEFPNSNEPYQQQLEFCIADEKDIDTPIKSESSIKEQFDQFVIEFEKHRSSALKNTDYYLSALRDLDIYVATSMRIRKDFRDMAKICNAIFNDAKLKDLNIRYFDPTLSASNCHEDKGLIECLMVKCAKMLIYYAGERDSYGKDAEAAMALSLGKPVIFYCKDENNRNEFFKNVHPLTRLIDFETGVAIGAMVTTDVKHVVSIISKTLQNKMTYRLEQREGIDNFLLLRETETDSVVRFQTGNKLLTEAFWNHYHEGHEMRDKIID